MPFAASFYAKAPTTPRLARCLRVLCAEIDDRYPTRATLLDGWIGDKRHQLRQSDHNPDGAGIVRAVDITAQGSDTRAILAAAVRHPATT